MSDLLANLLWPSRARFEPCPMCSKARVLCRAIQLSRRLQARTFISIFLLMVDGHRNGWDREVSPRNMGIPWGGHTRMPEEKGRGIWTGDFHTKPEGIGTRNIILGAELGLEVFRFTYHSHSRYWVLRAIWVALTWGLFPRHKLMLGFKKSLKYLLYHLFL